MSETLVLMLGDEARWLRLSDGAVVARGEGFETVPRADPGIEERVVAVVPAHELVVHHASLPDLAEPQARAAARLLVSEQSATPLETLHVAVGPAGPAGDRPVVAIEAAHMARHVAGLAALGYDPDAMLAAPLLLPRPDEGLVRGDLGSEVIVRGRNAAFADDAVLTPLIAGDAGVTDLDRAEIEAALMAAVADPEVDLRQGPFARVRRWAIDWKLVRRVALLGLALAGATLFLQLATIFKLSLAADRIEAANAAQARAVLPPGATVTNPVAQLDERLAALRGAGGGFLPLASAVAAAVNATANVELASMIFDGTGGLRVVVRAANPAELVAVEQRLIASGLAVAAGPVTSDQARPSRELTVRAR